MTLTEFLLARIAEDGDDTYELRPYECEPGCCAPAGWVGHECLICETVSYGGTVEAITAIAQAHQDDIHQHQRVLAECEAKRRIVTISRRAAIRDPTTDGYEEARARQTLRLLALPYADHPDYDPDWRP